MLAIGFALVAALLYGTSDFAGGWLSRGSHFVPVSLIGQAAAFGICLAGVVLTTPSFPDGAALWWSLLAGLGGGVGGLALYRGLGHGEMAVVGPLSAVGAAALPAVIGFLVGDQLSWLAWLGIAVALPAIWLVSIPRPDEQPEVTTLSTGRLTAGVLDGLIAGIGFACLFIGIERAGEGHGIWPVALAQGMSMVPSLALAAWLAWRGRILHRTPGLWRRAPWPGILVGLAVLAYQVSAQAGQLSIAAVITSLYPGITVLLARLLLGERTSRLQNVGLALCAVAVTTMALG